MENASKALLIAAAILIAIILIAFAMKVFNSPKDVVDNVEGMGTSISTGIDKATQAIAGSTSSSGSSTVKASRII